MNSSAHSVPRRTMVLATVGAGMLAACGSGGSQSAPSSGASAGPIVGPTANGTPGLAPTNQVPVQGGVVVQDSQGNPVVVVQPAPGQFLAYSAICPHAGCPVSQVQQNQILCPCHGSVFSSTDGSVLGGPAPSGLTPIPVHVTNGEVVAG